MLKITKKFDPKKDFNLICNDAFLVFPEIPNNHVDHCITDPPYNISGYDHKKQIGWLKSNNYWTDYKKYFKIEENWDKFSNNNYENFTKLWLTEIFRIVKPNGNIIIFGTHHSIFKIGYLLQGADKKILSFITWFKRNAFPNITQRMLCESTEHIIWAVNNTQKNAKNWTFNYKQLKELNLIKKCKKCKKVLNFNNKYCPYCGNPNLIDKKTQMRNMWNIPSTPVSEKSFGKHPSQKPLEIIKRLIMGATNNGELIVDPFMGSGTIPLMAKLLGRKFIGIDNNKNYCEIVYKRLNSTHQQNLF